MRENETVSVHTLNAPQSSSGQQRPNKGTYRAPRLVALGTAVELVQGSGGSALDATTRLSRRF
jgi:hypothetical protein